MTAFTAVCKLGRPCCFDDAVEKRTSWWSLWPGWNQALSLSTVFTSQHDPQTKPSLLTTRSLFLEILLESTHLRVSFADVWKTWVSLWSLYNLPSWRYTLILGVLCLYFALLLLRLLRDAHSWSVCSSRLLTSVQHIFSSHPFFNNGSTECWISQHIRSTRYLSIYDQTAVSCSDSLDMSNNFCNKLYSVHKFSGQTYEDKCYKAYFLHYVKSNGFLCALNLP